VHINCVLSDLEKIAANLGMYRNFFQCSCGAAIPLKGPNPTAFFCARLNRP
jgi:hypothetical protein